MELSSTSEVLINNRSYSFRQRRIISYNEYDLMLGMQAAKRAEAEIKNLQSRKDRRSKPSESSLGGIWLKNSQCLDKVVKGSHSVNKVFKSPQNKEKMLNTRSCRNDTAAASSKSSSRSRRLKRTPSGKKRSNTNRNSLWSSWMQSTVNRQVYKHDDNLRPKTIYCQKNNEYQPSCYLCGVDNTANFSDTKSSQYHETVESLKTNDMSVDNIVDIPNESNLISALDSDSKETFTIKHKADRLVETSKEACHSCVKVDTEKGIKSNQSHVEMDIIPFQKHSDRSRDNHITDDVDVERQKENKQGVSEQLTTKPLSFDEHPTSDNKANKLSPKKCPPIFTNISRQEGEYKCYKVSNYNEITKMLPAHTSQQTFLSNKNHNEQNFEGHINDNKINNAEFNSVTAQQESKYLGLLRPSKSCTTNSAEENCKEISIEQNLDIKQPQNSELREENVFSQNKGTSDSKCSAGKGEMKKDFTQVSEIKREYKIKDLGNLIQSGRFQSTLNNHNESDIANGLKQKHVAADGHKRDFYHCKVPSLLSRMVCKYCNRVFCRYNDLEVHTLLIHNQSKVDKFKCGNPVKQTFSESLHQKRFKAELDKEFPDRASDCAYNFSDENTENFNHSTSKGRYLSNRDMTVCTQKKKMATVLMYKYHNVASRLCKCAYCGRGFARKSDLDMHTKLCITEKQKQQPKSPSTKTYTCSKSKEKKCVSCMICTKAFSKPSDLNIHLRIHSGEKPHKCPICPRRFNQKGNLETHVKLHTDKRPFSCSQCTRRFRHASELKLHCRLHVRETGMPFWCSKCQRGYSRQVKLKQHICWGNVCPQPSCALSNSVAASDPATDICR